MVELDCLINLLVPFTIVEFWNLFTYLVFIFACICILRRQWVCYPRSIWFEVVAIEFIKFSFYNRVCIERFIDVEILNRKVFRKLLVSIVLNGACKWFVHTWFVPITNRCPCHHNSIIFPVFACNTKVYERDVHFFTNTICHDLTPCAWHAYLAFD